MVEDAVGQKSAPLPLLTCPQTSKVLPAPAPTRLICLLIITGPGSAVLSAQLPAARKTVSPLEAALTAACMQAVFHGLPEEPFPPPFAPQYVAAASMRLPTVMLKFCPWA